MTIKSKQLIRPQDIYKNNMTISQAKEALNSAIENIDVIDDIKLKLKNNQTVSDIHNNSKLIREINPEENRGMFYESTILILAFKDTDLITIPTAGNKLYDYIINTTMLVSVKDVYGVASGFSGVINLTPTDMKDDIVYKVLIVLNTKKNIMEKMLIILRMINHPFTLNGHTLTLEEEEILIKKCAKKDDKDTKARTRHKDIEIIKDLFINVFGQNVFDTYIESFKINQPLWFKYKEEMKYYNSLSANERKEQNIKKPYCQKHHLDYMKYDVFVLHMVYKYFSYILNNVWTIWKDFFKEVFKRINLYKLSDDGEKIILKKMWEFDNIIEISDRYFGELNYHGGGTISFNIF